MSCKNGKTTLVTTCKPGVVAGVDQICPDLSAARGIEDITESQDGKTLIITYTDGTSQTFTLPEGPAGQNGQNGGNGIATLWNDFTPKNTTSLGTDEILNTQTLKKNTLVDVGDSIRLRYAWTCTDPTSAGTIQFVRLELNGQPVNLGIAGAATFQPKNTNKLIVDIYVTMTGATTANADCVLTDYTVNVGLGGTVYVANTEVQATIPVTGLNFALDQPVVAIGNNQPATTIVTYQQGRADLFLIKI